MIKYKKYFLLDVVPVVIAWGPVIRATFSFNLSHKIVDILCCEYYHVCDQLVWLSKLQSCKLRQYVVQSRLEFYFLQQILVLLLVLSLKLQLVSQQVRIQGLWLAIVKRGNVANKKRNGGQWRRAWIRKSKGLEELSQKNGTFAFNCSHLKRQLHNERTSLPWKIKKKVTAASRSWIS